MGDYKRQHQMPARYFENWGRDEDVERRRRFKPKKRKLKDESREQRREQENGR